MIGGERKAHLEAPDVPGDGGVPELHLVQRGHGEGGGEQDAAHDPDGGRERPEVPRRDAAAPGAVLLRLLLPLLLLLVPPRRRWRTTQPADVGGADSGPHTPAPGPLHRRRGRRRRTRRSSLHFRCSIDQGRMATTTGPADAGLAWRRGMPQLTQHGTRTPFGTGTRGA